MGPNIFEANKANTSNADIVDKFGLKGRRKKASQDTWLNLIVNQDTTVNNALNDWKLHMKIIH